jgi:hypothetical protein
MNIPYTRPNADEMTLFTYENQPITRRGEMLNLTQMWVANGRLKNQKPGQWLRLPSTEQFSERLASVVGLSHNALIVTERGAEGSTWTHWQLALVYAHYLSPDFYIWCNQIVHNAIELFGGPAVAAAEPMGSLFEEAFGRLHRRFDVLGQYASDNLVLTAATMSNAKSKPFTERTKRIIIAVLRAEPFEGVCPCCSATLILNEAGERIAVAEFDHFYGGGLNRPEYGWLICKSCHDDFTRGSPLLRIGNIRSFHAFQAEVLNYLTTRKAGSIAIADD